MRDPSVFAVLTACDKSNRAATAFSLPENNDFYRKATTDITKEPTISSRDPTPVPERSVEADSELGDRIVLRFDDDLKDFTNGWQFGTDPKTCDILLGHRGTAGISARHFSITITKTNCVELCNDSKFGTVVSYNGQIMIPALKGEKRILCMNLEKYKDWASVIIFVPYEGKLMFTISFPRREESEFTYLENLRTFVRKRQKAFPMISQLGLSTTSTVAPINHSRRISPNGLVIYKGKELGRGTFSQVLQCIDVTNGNMYAVKLFRNRFKRAGDMKARNPEEQKWLNNIRREVAIMQNNPHPHVMQVKHFFERPLPSLFMPLYRLGSLNDCTGIKRWQYTTVYQQALLGLAHLHGRGVTHRDLKPANILVAQLNPLHIVLSDFGVSKAVGNDEMMLSFCGTALYNAPEVLRDGVRGTRRGYSNSIDIWALGVMMLELSFGLPDRSNLVNVRPDGHSQTWPMLIISKINYTKKSCDKLIELVAQMVVHQPDARLSADECLQQGYESGIFTSDDDDDASLDAQRTWTADTACFSKAHRPDDELSEDRYQPESNFEEANQRQGPAAEAHRHKRAFRDGTK